MDVELMVYVWVYIGIYCDFILVYFFLFFDWHNYICAKLNINLTTPYHLYVQWMIIVFKNKPIHQKVLRFFKHMLFSHIINCF